MIWGGYICAKYWVSICNDRAAIAWVTHLVKTGYVLINGLELRWQLDVCQPLEPRRPRGYDISAILFFRFYSIEFALMENVKI